MLLILKRIKLFIVDKVDVVGQSLVHSVSGMNHSLKTLPPRLGSICVFKLKVIVETEVRDAVVFLSWLDASLENLFPTICKSELSDVLVCVLHFGKIHQQEFRMTRQFEVYLFLLLALLVTRLLLVGNRP